MFLEGKKAVITGISRGIGKALAQQLLEKGCAVAGIGKTEPDYSHQNLSFFNVDVRNEDQTSKAIKLIENQFNNEVDILINNAGLGYFGYFEEMSEAQFDEIFKVNVYGIFHTCREIIPLMKSRKTGHIINISSIAGLEGMEQVAAYCGAKHAVRGITDSLFKELRTFGIKVTGVYPGSTQTNFFDNAEGITAHDKMMQPEEVAKQIIHALETSDNFLYNAMVFRPLNVKPSK